MTNEIVKMSANYPLLSCWRNGNFWSGFIRIHGRLLRLSIDAPKFPSIEGIKLHGDEEMKSVCDPLNDEVSLLLIEEMLLSEFMSNFTDLLKKCWTNSYNEGSPVIIADLNPEFYTILLKELEEIGLDKISFVSSNYCEIHINHFDVTGREHVVIFHLSSGYPFVSLKVVSQLPIADPDTFVWPNKVLESNQVFLTELRKYSEFWNEMDNIDEICRVIDPAKPNRSHNFRRILIQEKVVMHLTLNPLNPRTYPELRLTGPEKVVERLDLLLENRRNKWNENRTVLDNLQDILEIEFLPKKTADDDTGNNDELDLNCIICYMYDLEGEVPERTCACSASFHNRCLYDLYVNDFVGTGRKFVECPVCSAELRIVVTFA